MGGWGDQADEDDGDMSPAAVRRRYAARRAQEEAAEAAEAPPAEGEVRWSGDRASAWLGGRWCLLPEDWQGPGPVPTTPGAGGWWHDVGGPRLGLAEFAGAATWAQLSDVRTRAGGALSLRWVMPYLAADAHGRLGVVARAGYRQAWARLPLSLAGRVERLAWVWSVVPGALRAEDYRLPAEAWPDLGALRLVESHRAPPAALVALQTYARDLRGRSGRQSLLEVAPGNVAPVAVAVLKTRNGTPSIAAVAVIEEGRPLQLAAGEVAGRQLAGALAYEDGELRHYQPGQVEGGFNVTPAMLAGGSK